MESTYAPREPPALVVTADGQEIEAASVGLEGAIGGVVYRWLSEEPSEAVTGTVPAE